MSCGGKEREEKHTDRFIESINEDFDPTYRDHYFKAVENIDYDKIVKALIKWMQESWEKENE